jgi:predicted TIM-barrel fold metal-dependent hydrolase
MPIRHPPSAILFRCALAAFIFVLGSSSAFPASQESYPDRTGQAAALAALAKLNPIDAHVHAYKDDPAFNALLRRLRLGVLNICVIDDRDADYKGLEPQRSQVLSVSRSAAGRAAFCTTFSPYDFEDPGFAQRVIRQLDDDFSEGAIAVKVYKTIGMEIRTKTGAFLMADDPVFEPIYRHIAAHHRTLVAHLAEPTSCWEPPNPASPDYGYYRKYPAEYAYLHPEYPSKAAILAARDRILASHPQLLVVGAHLGSMETDVGEIAARLDRYPNFAVDTAGRVHYLMLQPRDKVRSFLIKYQDRILYGTDLVFMTTDKTEVTLAKWADTYERDWKYFAGKQTVQYKEHNIQGLGLPKAVLRKLYRENALRWLPGIAGTTSPSR